MEIINKLLIKLGIQTSEFEKFQLIENHSTEYQTTFDKLEQTLKEADLAAHAEVVRQIHLVLIGKDFQRFIRRMNSVDMWGGSGAVCEVYIKDPILERDYNLGMLRLINLMEKTKILGGGIKPLRDHYDI
jgi:hypothetical protein